MHDIVNEAYGNYKLTPYSLVHSALQVGPGLHSTLAVVVITFPKALQILDHEVFTLSCRKGSVVLGH